MALAYQQIRQNLSLQAITSPIYGTYRAANSTKLTCTPKSRVYVDMI